jgi:hypothetical protein
LMMILGTLGTLIGPLLGPFLGSLSSLSGGVSPNLASNARMTAVAMATTSCPVSLRPSFGIFYLYTGKKLCAQL